MHPCDIPSGMLESTKEWRQDVKYVNHPSNMTDLCWHIEPTPFYSSDMM